MDRLLGARARSDTPEVRADGECGTDGPMGLLGQPRASRERGPIGPTPPSLWAYRSHTPQKRNFAANCICLAEPESPVGNRVLLITPNDVLPMVAVRPG